ncbi:MAG: hypothetical protein ACREBR_01650, partial [bacterium]
IDCCEAQDDDAASTSGGGIASSTIAPGVGNMFELVDDDDNDNELSNFEEQYSNGKREASCSPVFARKCGKSDDECSSGDYSGEEGLGDDVQGVDGRGEGSQGDEVMFEQEPSNAVFGDERDKKRYDFVHLLTDDQIHFDTDAPSESWFGDEDDSYDDDETGMYFDALEEHVARDLVFLPTTTVERDLGNCNNFTFNQQLNYDPVILLCENKEVSPLHEAEELLLHYVKKKNNLPPNVYDFVMSWAKDSAAMGHNLNGPKYRTAIKRCICRYGERVGGLPIRGTVEVDGFSPVDIYRNNFLNHAKRMYADSSLMSNGLWTYDRTTNGYGELNTGEFWRECEGSIAARLNRKKSRFENRNMPPNHYIAPIMLFDDGTQCDILGRLVAHPVLFSLGNINGKNRRSHRAWSILSILPPYPKTQQEQAKDNKKPSTQTKALEFYHQCLNVVLREIRYLCGKMEGVPMFVHGLDDVVPYFDLYCVIGDIAGHDKMCCHYCSYTASISRMVRDCDVPTKHGDDPFFQCRKTHAADVKAIVQPAIIANSIFEEGTINGQHRAAMRKISQHPVASAYWNFNFGGSCIHQSLPHEILHMFYLGLFKRMLCAVYHHAIVPPVLKNWMSKRKAGSRLGNMKNRPKNLKKYAKSQFRGNEFERRMRNVSFLASRQSDRDMPRSSFKNGVSQLTRLCGQEYPGLILLTIVCMGNILGDVTYDEARRVERKYCLLLWRSLSLEKMLTEEHYSTAELELLRKRIIKYLDMYRDCVGPQREMESACGLRIPKYHAALHVADQVKRFGSNLNAF